MATRRLNDDSGASSSKKPKMKTPQLNSESCKVFLYFHLVKNQPAHGIDIVEKQLRALTVNKRFLNAFFDYEGNNNQMAELSVIGEYNMQLKFYVEGFEICLQPLKIGHLMIPLQLAAMKKLKICIQVYAAARFRNIILNCWIQICRALKDNKTLQDIHVYMKFLPSSTNRILIDLIPDKIVEFKITDDIMSCLSKNRMALESLTISECNTRKNLSYIFKTKTKYLTFARAPWNGGSGKDGLLSLADCGRLSSNPSIEHLKINIQFAPVKKSRLLSLFSVLEYGESDTDTSTSYLSEYERALKCLKMVNPNMGLDLTDNNSYKEDSYTNYEDIITDLELLTKNVKEFLDLAQRIGTKIECIQLQHKHKIIYGSWSHSKNVKMADKLDFELFYGNELHGTQYHNNVPIFFDQRLIRDNQDWNFADFDTLEFLDYLDSNDEQEDEPDDVIAD